MADGHLPIHQKIGGVETAPKTLGHIHDDYFSYSFGAKATDSDSSVKTV